MNKHIEEAKKYCETKNYRFTEPRERVLKVLVESTKPMGAYDIIKALSTKKHQVKPATVYRAIDFWIYQGYVHKINSLNSYLACCHEHSHGHSFIFICEQCDETFELETTGLPANVLQLLKKNKASLSHSSTELYGNCQHCH